MYNKKSDYAINKRNSDAIVYTDADENEIKLTRDDFEARKNFSAGKHGQMPSTSRPRKTDAAITITPLRSSTMLIHTARLLKMS